MERDISIKFWKTFVIVFSSICIGALFAMPDSGTLASADTVQIRQPVVVAEHQSRSEQSQLEQLETVRGAVLIEAQDGSMLFQEMDGTLRVLAGSEVASKTIQEVPLLPMTKKELGESLLAELPEGFEIYTTDDYVIAYQTERAYAKWIGNLYQGRLNRSFKNFWRKRKFKLKVEAPKFPLVAVIFATREQYAAQVQRELNVELGAMFAYYNLLTNRVMMYDLTADQRPGAAPVKNQRDIDRILDTSQGITMVTTVIHEGAHQLMFNSGLQTRLADTPLWLNEGIAMFFEAPDLRARQGWNGPGRTNYPRLSDLQRKSTRAANALESLIVSDKVLQSEGEATLIAYAESWALTHFLINRRPVKFGEYLKFLSKKQPQQPPEQGQRLADFKQFFGDDLQKLDKEFIDYVNRIK